MKQSVPHDLPVFEKKRRVTIVMLPGDGIIKPSDVERVCSVIEKEIVAAPAKHDFLFSFHHVQYISSLFIGNLMSFYKKLAAKGGKLMLCDMHPQLATVIRLARLERQMPVYPSRAQALTGRTPALTGLITTTALSGLAGIGLAAKLLTDSQVAAPRILATLYLLANLPLPVLLWWNRRTISSFTPRKQWLLVTLGAVLLVLAVLVAILA